MLTSIRRTAVAVVAAGLSMASVAGPTLHGTTTNPTGFTGLVVDGITYSVSFTVQSYDAAFASSPPAFLGNESGGLDAALALVSALNTTGVTELGDYVFPQSVPVQYYDVFVPTEFYSGQLSFDGYGASRNKALNEPWRAFGGGLGLVNQPGGVFGERYSQIAVFSVQAVPEPSTIALMGMGIAALALARKRRL